MKMKTHKSINVFFGYVFFIVMIMSVVLLINKAFANEQNNDTGRPISAVSLGQKKTIDNSEEKFKQLREQLMVQASVKSNAFATGKLRSQKKRSAKSSKNAKASSHHYFQIFQAQSYLLKDLDHDGYYQEFTVSFDADVEAHSAEVYAELYLSKNGGPWRHYYTTDVFTIFGDSQNDEYEVFTQLVDGYDPDEYDVMIDLYEYGYSDVVASFSDADTDNLYALPLESVYYDDAGDDYISHSHGHGGAYSIWVLLFLLPFAYFRLTK